MSDTPAGRVTDPKKLAAIRNVLSLPETSGAFGGGRDCGYGCGVEAAAAKRLVGCRRNCVPIAQPQLAGLHVCSVCGCVILWCVCAAPVEVTTVFQIAGPETPGLLAEVTQLLSHNGLEIRTAAVSTQPLDTWPASIVISAAHQESCCAAATC